MDRRGFFKSILGISGCLIFWRSEEPTPVCAEDYLTDNTVWFLPPECRDGQFYWVDCKDSSPVSMTDREAAACMRIKDKRVIWGSYG